MRNSRLRAVRMRAKMANGRMPISEQCFSILGGNFSRKEIEKALKASKNDEAKAIDMLLSYKGHVVQLNELYPMLDASQIEVNLYTGNISTIDDYVGYFGRIWIRCGHGSLHFDGEFCNRGRKDQRAPENTRQKLCPSRATNALQYTQY